MDLSEKTLNSFVTRLSAHLGDYLANNAEFIQRIAANIPQLESRDVAASFTDSPAGGYAAFVDTGASTTGAAQHPAREAPSVEYPFVFQIVKEKTTEKTTTHYSAQKMACPTCGKMLTMRYLPAHMNTHLMYNSRPFPCEFCEKCYAHKKNFDRHMRDKHPGCQDV